MAQCGLEILIHKGIRGSHGIESCSHGYEIHDTHIRRVSLNATAMSIPLYFAIGSFEIQASFAMYSLTSPEPSFKGSNPIGYKIGKDALLVTSTCSYSQDEG